MASVEKKLPIAIEQERAKQSPRLVDPWQPLTTLHQQVNRLFDDFSPFGLRQPLASSLFDVEPLLQREFSGLGMPAMDIAEKEKAFELTAELPGMDEKNIEIKLSNGNLLIRGEKKEETEEKKKDYYLSERRYGTFERRFNLPKGVDAEHIEARFSKGVLTVSLPKKPEAIKPERSIKIKAS
jgi:HSP20 family protein